MRLQLQFKHYLDELRSRSNDAVSLNTLLAPYQIVAGEDVKTDMLLVGHVLDYLAQDHQPNDVVDPLDIAQAALELGLEGAEGFIDAFPYMATQTLRAMLEEFGH